MVVCFYLSFLISPDSFKTESEEFRTGRKVENFTRLRAACVVFKKKYLLKFNFQWVFANCSKNQNKVLKPVGCFASPNTGDFARKKSPRGGEIHIGVRAGGREGLQPPQLWKLYHFSGKTLLIIWATTLREDIK